jgi:hypothetical protein
MNKEDIIESNPVLVQVISAHGVGCMNLINKVMDEWAKQQSISFINWMNEHTVKVGDHCLCVFRDSRNYSGVHTTEECYDKFIEEQLQISNNNTLIP